MTDEELHLFVIEICAQRFDSCSKNEIDKRVFEMVATRNPYHKKTVSIFKADGTKGNQKNATGVLPGGLCTTHTFDLLVKEFLEGDAVAHVAKKMKGMTTYFHHSSNRLI